MMTHLSKLSLAVFLLGALTACDDDDRKPIGQRGPVLFHHEGLDGREVIRLYEHDGRYFAATDKGLYSKEAGASQWQATGLKEQHVYDIAFIDDGHSIASVRSTVGEATAENLVETLDAGASWEIIEHDFGGEDREAAFGFHFDADNNALFATGRDALAVSYDEGYSWDLLAGDWGSFSHAKNIVKLNAATNEVWYGGQNAIEQMVLNRYSLDTEELQSFPDLLPAPAVIYGIQFHPEDEQTVIVSGEGGIMKSEDNGENWQSLTGDVDHRFYFDLAFDPSDADILYTAGWTKNWETPQPLILELSRDAGKTWTKYQHPSNKLFGGMRSILAATEAGKTVLYLGLYGGGVMKVSFR